jgi:hypothetical protein
MNWRTRAFSTCLGLMICASLVACAKQTGASTGPTGSTGPTESPSLGGLHPGGWGSPFHDQGVLLRDQSDLANRGTSFRLYSPTSLDAITPAIYVPPGDSVGDYDAVFFVFQDPRYGVIWIGESAPDIADDSQRMKAYEERVSENDNPDIHSTAELVTIRDGVDALLGIAANGVCTLQWVEKDTQFFVMGPTLDKNQVLQIAEAI